MKNKICFKCNKPIVDREFSLKLSNYTSQELSDDVNVVLPVSKPQEISLCPDCHNEFKFIVESFLNSRSIIDTSKGRLFIDSLLHGDVVRVTDPGLVEYIFKSSDILDCITESEREIFRCYKSYNRPIAKWIYEPEYKGTSKFKCSNCGRRTGISGSKHNYCSKCGSYMEE